MNLLVTSAGRRVKVIQYFKQSLSKIKGNVIATDCDINAPALYFADKFEIVPRINENNYISILLNLCKKHNIKGIVSLIDPELELLAENRSKFEEQGIVLILSPLEMVKFSFDKQQTYDYLCELGIPGVPTYSDINLVLSLLNEGKLNYPLVIKPGKGSASIGLNIVNDEVELLNIFNREDDLIVQPFFKDKEFGIDVYIDMLSGDLVDLFIKEKINMRAGETDKSVSVKNIEIESLVKDLISKTNFTGPIDIDCFEYDGGYYISEINPRFGGGYPHACEMGCNFMEYIVNNLNEIENSPYDGFKYNSGYIMMKYDDVKIIKKPLEF
ncbi:ATP-grasp domain-containing protein [Pseudogracilibacillus sp. SE30717A]|uniref:ATP-grasp domain-containing protein n=1 Tax=Pseudogracilibacillus sp. SE30717A TaxID=3098293 RepID=UPI00300E4364